MEQLNKDKIFPKPSVNHLQTFNLAVAAIAGILSIVGGVYSLKTNVFASSASGSFKGIVRDQALAKPLWLSSIEVTDEKGHLVDSAESGEDGAYLIKDLKEGDYLVKVSAPRHANRSKPVKIEKGKTASVNFDLAPEQTPYTAPAAYTALPVQEAYAPASYEPRPQRHRRRLDYRDYNSAEPAETPAPSLQNAILQIGGELVQQWAGKKSGNQAGSSSASSASSSSSGQSG